MTKTRMYTVFISLLTLTGIACTQANPASKEGPPEGWLTNYEQALSEAKEQNKPILIEFTGSDWCPPCMRLEREVLSTDTFKAFAGDSLVLLYVDFPRRKQLSEEQTAHNNNLAKQYGIQYFPTVFVLDSSGKVISQIQYQGGGPDPFIASIKKALQ